MKLNSTQREILRLCADNSLGRVGWPLQTWEAAAEAVCKPMIRAGLIEFMRLGGYPGVKITDTGRAALSPQEDTP
ncbi:hypothetical protein ACVIRO_002398 [Rhizobium ruizarguesonis]